MDWKQFFLNAGLEEDLSQQYAKKFEENRYSFFDKYLELYFLNFLYSIISWSFYGFTVPFINAYTNVRPEGKNVLKTWKYSWVMLRNGYEGNERPFVHICSDGLAPLQFKNVDNIFRGKQCLRPLEALYIYPYVVNA